MARINTLLCWCLLKSLKAERHYNKSIKQNLTRSHTRTYTPHAHKPTGYCVCQLPVSLSASAAGPKAVDVCLPLNWYLQPVHFCPSTAASNERKSVYS